LKKRRSAISDAAHNQQDAALVELRKEIDLVNHQFVGNAMKWDIFSVFVEWEGKLRWTIEPKLLKKIDFVDPDAMEDLAFITADGLPQMKKKLVY